MGHRRRSTIPISPAALIKRAGNAVLGIGPRPQIVGDDLNDVADRLVVRHGAIRGTG